MANTTSFSVTPRSPSCALPNAAKSSNPSTDLIRAKSPPAITLNARFSRSAAAGEHASERARRRCQKSRQIETNWMLNLPVEPHPVKKILPPERSAARTDSWMRTARPDPAKSRYFATTSASAWNNRSSAAATSRDATSLSAVVAGCDDSVTSMPSLNWPLTFRNSRERWSEASLMRGLQAAPRPGWCSARRPAKARSG